MTNVRNINVQDLATSGQFNVTTEPNAPEKDGPAEDVTLYEDYPVLRNNATARNVNNKSSDNP